MNITRPIQPTHKAVRLIHDVNMYTQLPFFWKCGTPVFVGDVVEYGGHIGVVHWCDYFRSYQISVGTGLTLCNETIDEFHFLRRGIDNQSLDSDAKEPAQVS